jgi:hypothetical protein
LRQFHKLLPASLLISWLALCENEFYSRAFTPLISLWYMIFLRLNPNHTLSSAVEDASAGGADRLSPRGKRLSNQLRSMATTSFSDARQRLPLEICSKALSHIAARIIGSIQVPQFFGLRVGLLDGSTCRMRPFGDIPKHFPPHRPGNCKKEPYWCLARVVGMICMATGAVMRCQIDTPKMSEQALCARLLAERAWNGWLFVADRNFGVYSVLRAILGAQAHGLVRLTESRAAKMARSAGVKLVPGLDARINWTPSRHDHCPEGLAPQTIEGRLIAVRIERPGYRSMTLHLFTTLLDQCPVDQLLELYGQRWKIEICFRYIKSQMDLGFLECHSAGMARKEWLAGLIAYNLIRWTMAAAAASSEVPVQMLSFSRTRELLVGWLRRTSISGRTVASWKQLLKRIVKARLPKRRKPRPPEPRAMRAFQKDVAKLEGSRAEARRKLREFHANS